MSGLSGRCNDDDLRELFGKHGPVRCSAAMRDRCSQPRQIIKCQVILDPHTRESRGFAFVHFEQAVDAEAAIDALNGTDFMGKMLSVQKARRGRARTPTRQSSCPRSRTLAETFDSRPIPRTLVCS